MDMLKNLILKNRSYRRFYQNESINEQILRDLVDLARLSPSGGNKQPLKFMLSNKHKTNSLIFQHLAWASYLKNWPGPIDGERPSAYIIILGDTKISPSFGCDQGIAAQSIMLGAVEKGFGGCIIASIKRNELQKQLRIPESLEILLVIALGRPKEKVIIEEAGPDGDIKYWRNGKDHHHVPKRSIKDIIIS
jgi:nitroreductase